MKIYDISLPLDNNMVIYPGDPGFHKETLTSVATDGYVISRISMGSHTGTHIDAPGHFIENGQTVDQIDLDILNGPVQVLDTGSVKVIDKQAVMGQLQPVARVILKTVNSHLKLLYNQNFNQDYVHLDWTAAEYLVQQGIRLVGIDYLSIEKFNSDDYPVHNVLLANKIIILEGVNMAAVPAGIYQLCCLPLKIANCDAAPVRAILIAR